MLRRADDTGYGRPFSTEDGALSLIRFFLVLFTIFGVALNGLLWIYVSLPFVAVYRPPEIVGAITITFPGHRFGIADMLFFLSFLLPLSLIGEAEYGKNGPTFAAVL